MHVSVGSKFDPLEKSVILLYWHINISMWKRLFLHVYMHAHVKWSVSVSNVFLQQKHKVCVLINWPSVCSINVMVPQGSLLAVVGHVGCGKTSLVSALLGEMEKLEGQISIRVCVLHYPERFTSRTLRLTLFLSGRALWLTYHSKRGSRTALWETTSCLADPTWSRSTAVCWRPVHWPLTSKCFLEATRQRSGRRCWDFSCFAWLLNSLFLLQCCQFNMFI